MNQTETFLKELKSLTKDINIQTFGALGGLYISDTNAHTGNFFCFYPFTDGAFSANTGNVSGLGTASFKAGIPIFGQFTSLTLSSGTGIAYYSKVSQNTP